MTIWPPKREDLKRPAYHALAECLVKAISAGEVGIGDRLPTHRDLAYQLGLSVQTISRAYDELIRRGVIAGEVGRGTFVRATGDIETRTPFLPDNSFDTLIDCSILKPVCDEIHMAHMRKALAELGQTLPSSAIFSFRPTNSLQSYRDTLVAWLSLCGVDIRPEVVILTNGNTSAMTIAMMSAAKSGDLIVTEEVGHHTLKPLAHYLGLRLMGIEVDSQGIVPEHFERICKANAVKALYVMPTGLSPMAAVMGLRRRKALCAIARKYDVLIIENDAWGPIQSSRPSPIAALEPERTFYFTSFTKCIMPGLRAGYLVVPDAFASGAANRHLVTNWIATPLMAEIASRWIADGTAQSLLEWQREALGKRNALAADILGDLPFRASPNGLHIWLPLPEHWSEEMFVGNARLLGVAVAPGSAFAVSDPIRKPGVRICLGASSESELQRALEIVSQLVRSQPEPVPFTM